MVWFNKKKENSENEGMVSLPELPKLPEFSNVGGKNFEESIHQLPSFPSNSLGEKFSQDTIKNAITGEKEDEEVFEANDFAPGEDEMQMMQKPLKESLTKEVGFPIEKRKTLLSSRIPKEFKKTENKIGKSEPIFIRIDKFEESLQIFEKVKTKILEMETMLRDVKRIKEEEEKELTSWESGIQMIKGQIEKIDNDIFSKIE